MEVVPDKKQLYADPVLSRILDQGVLVATTDYSSTSYFIYRGEPMGYQYELLKEFADFLGVRLEVRISNDLEQSFACLNNFDCDLIAIGLTVTGERQKNVNFTLPLGETRQVLVQRRHNENGEFIDSPLELAGKTVHVPERSAYVERLNNLSQEIGAPVEVITHSGTSVEELIRAVARGEIEFTVADEHIAKVNRRYYPEIDISVAVSFPQHIAWAVHKGSGRFLDTLNLWLGSFKKKKQYALLYNKYFRNPSSVSIARNEYFSLKGGKISPYDKIFRKYSSLLDWDWRLIASLVYQESRFSTEARSWAGAFGLMQLMPNTARALGVDTTSPPEEQIKAGIVYLNKLDRQLRDLIPDKEERVKFVLAAYNAGIAHVYDARRLAEKYNRDPSRWDNNVDYFLLNKSKPQYYNDSVVKYGYCRGEETYNFVAEILDRYHHYQNMIPE
ncbi:MAG: transporter substrate-binding domain-containing protein [Bacteroidales bacterium]